MARKVHAVCISSAMLACLFLFSSCSYFPGTTADLIPLPVDVSIQELPEIVSCTATFAVGSCEDQFERICGPFCWDEEEEEWRYCCRAVWRYTECVGDIVVSMTVNDPSDDLDSAKYPRVRVLDSQPGTGGTDWGTCQLNLRQTDIPISRYDVTGGGVLKTVVVRIRNVPLRFTGGCRAFRATLPVTVLFEDAGQVLTSRNTYDAAIEYSRR